MAKRSALRVRRVVKLLRNGHNQVVRIPREFRLPGATALLAKEGNRLTLEPIVQRNFIAALRALGSLPPADRFPAIDDPPPEAIDL